MNKLLKIQSELKAPKSQFNSFGKYNYRNCEDILEALKPLLKENDVTFYLSDEIVTIGNRIYVKTTATLIDGDIKTISCGFAREDESKKGMDACQVSGAASSYARKYALNALFLIDDTKDSDTTNSHMVNEQDKKTATSNSEPIKRHTDASAMAPNDGLSVTGKISNHISGNPWHKFTINGIELSTKNPMDIEALTDHKGNDEEIEVTYTEITKGKWTNRYITAIQLVVKDIPF